MLNIARRTRAVAHPAFSLLQYPILPLPVSLTNPVYLHCRSMSNISSAQVDLEWCRNLPKIEVGALKKNLLAIRVSFLGCAVVDDIPPPLLIPLLPTDSLSSHTPYSYMHICMGPFERALLKSCCWKRSLGQTMSIQPAKTSFMSSKPLSEETATSTNAFKYFVSSTGVCLFLLFHFG